jgi:hypothetical protein
MHTRVSLFVLPVLAAGIACVKPVNTVPAPVSPTAAVQGMTSSCLRISR